MSERTRRHPLRSWFDSLAARTVLVVLIGIGLVHFASIWVYETSLERQVELTNEERLADRLLTIKRAVMRVPPDEREAVAHDLSGGSVEAHWSRVEHAVAGATLSPTIETLGVRLRTLAPELAEDGLILGPSRRAADDPHLALISMRLPDESWVNVSLLAWTPRVHAGHGNWWSTTLMALGAIVVSAFIVRWITRPLSTFAAAVERYEAVNPTPVPEHGPAEVKSLAVAFNEMQTRIKRLVEDRTQALAAVSHDLKTPITRLRFRAEDIADAKLQTEILSDLNEMERMLDQTLAYLRGDRTEEELRPLDLVALLRSLADDVADAGQRVEIAGEASAVLPGRRLALKRAFGNLIDNAVKYGGCARVRVAADPAVLRVEIDDDGPGIAAEDRQRVLQPFVRLEGSRNVDTGGFGLGLTIAESIIAGHRGTLAFDNRPEGGLRVTVRLPRAA